MSWESSCGGGTTQKYARKKKGGYLGSTSIDRKDRRREDGEDPGVIEVDNTRAREGCCPRRQGRRPLGRKEGSSELNIGKCLLDLGTGGGVGWWSFNNFSESVFQRGLGSETRLQRISEWEARKWKQLEGISFQEGCLVNKKRSMRQELEGEMALRGRRGPLGIT